MRRGSRILALLPLALFAAPPVVHAGADPAPGATVARTTRVSYLAGTTVYIEAGRLDGLAVDDFSLAGDATLVSTHASTWGTLKTFYH